MIRLLYCSDAGGFDGVLISVMALTRHTRRPVEVWLLTMDLRTIDPKHRPITEEMRMRLEAAAQAQNPASRVMLLDETALFLREVAEGNPNMDSFYTPYCMLRLIADLVPELPEKLLYLDTDTVPLGDTGELYDLDLTGYELAAADDFLGRWFKYIGYINSGVLLLNLPLIRQTGLFRKTRDGCRERRTWFPDQDALNKNLTARLSLPERFNSQRRLKRDTVILHCCKSIRWLPFYHTVNVKPWQIDRVHRVLHLHAFDDVLTDYTNLKKAMNENGYTA